MPGPAVAAFISRLYRFVFCFSKLQGIRAKVVIAWGRNRHVNTVTTGRDVRLASDLLLYPIRGTWGTFSVKRSALYIPTATKLINTRLGGGKESNWWNEEAAVDFLLRCLLNDVQHSLAAVDTGTGGKLLRMLAPRFVVKSWGVGVGWRMIRLGYNEFGLGAATGRDVMEMGRGVTARGGWSGGLCAEKYIIADRCRVRLE